MTTVGIAVAVAGQHAASGSAFHQAARDAEVELCDLTEDLGFPGSGLGGCHSVLLLRRGDPPIHGLKAFRFQGVGVALRPFLGAGSVTRAFRPTRCGLVCWAVMT